MRALVATILVLRLAAAPVGAQEDGELRDLRARFDKGSVAFRNGDDGAARAAFEAVASALAPAFAAGRIPPRSTDEAWVLYGGAVLMQSDLWRYRLAEPRRAREIEEELAAGAARQGYVDLAAAQWLAVADIERHDLHDDAAALAAYRKVLALAKVDPGLRGQALQGLARTAGGDPAAIAGVVADLPLSLEHIEATSLVIPHLTVYRSGDQASAYGAFAVAHPRSYRATYGDYAGFLVTIVFRHEKAADPATPAAAFLGRHGGDVLALDVLYQLAEFQQGQGRASEAQETRQRQADLKADLGLVGGPAARPPDAKSRPLLNGAGTPRAAASATSAVSR